MYIIFIHFSKTNNVKNIVTAMLLLFFYSGFAQPFAGIQINSFGTGLHAGYQKKLDSSIKSISCNSILFTAGMNQAFQNAKNPSLYYVTIGYLYSFSKKNAYNILVTAGPAYQHFRAYENYNHAVSASMIVVQKICPVYIVEIGKDWHKGRCFMQSGFCGKFFM